jgi:hypothetical protein
MSRLGDARRLGYRIAERPGQPPPSGPLPDLVRMAGAAASRRDDRLCELWRLAELDR